MKKILFTCILSSIIFAANAQVNKGAILLGGTITGGFNKSEQGVQETKANGFSIRPSIGFAYKPNRVFGVSLGYGTGKSESTSGSYLGINRTKSYGAGVYFRRYFPIASRFSLFGQADLNYDYQRATSTSTAPFSSNFIDKTQRAGLYLSPGASFSVSKKIMIETSFGSLLGLQYQTSERNYTGSSTQPTTKQNQFSINADAFPAYGLNLGFRIILGNK